MLQANTLVDIQPGLAEAGGGIGYCYLTNACTLQVGHGANTRAMASNLRAMASNLLAMASNLAVYTNTYIYSVSFFDVQNVSQIFTFGSQEAKLFDHPQSEQPRYSIWHPALGGSHRLDSLTPICLPK